MRTKTVLLALILASCSQDDLEAPRVEVPEAERKVQISRGESIEIEDHLPDAGWTLVEFGAEWCSPCRKLAPKLAQLVEERPFVRLRLIDIDSWDSPIVQRYGIRSIPQLWLYDGKTRLTEDLGRAMALVRAQR